MGVGQSGPRKFAVVETLAAAAKQQMRNFVPQDLTNTVWAIVNVDHTEQQLFETVAVTVKQQLRDLNPHRCSQSDGTKTLSCQRVGNPKTWIGP